MTLRISASTDQANGGAGAAGVIIIYCYKLILIKRG